MSSDKNWAKEYILDPLNAPEPSQETGPGTHFGNTLAKDPKRTSTHADVKSSATSSVSAVRGSSNDGSGSPVTIGSNNPFRHSRESSISSTGRPRATSDAPNRLQKKSSPPPLANNPAPESARGTSSGQHRKIAFASLDQELSHRSRSGSAGQGNSHLASGSGNRHSRNVSNASNTSGRSRADSLGQTPLEAARDEVKLAHRSPHLRKHHQPGRDVIDRLDFAGFHHDNPYDAAGLARNSSFETSPLAAVRGTNAEALKATPRENVLNSIQKHRPLDGVAFIPPGETDRFGRRYDYEEGDNMMTFNGANYKRWADVDYLPEDYKGKGEPSFSIERSMKEHKEAKRHEAGEMGGAQAASSGIEMQGGPVQTEPSRTSLDGVDHSGARRNSSKRLSVEGIKKRIGSIRGKKGDSSSLVS